MYISGDKISNEKKTVATGNERKMRNSTKGMGKRKRLHGGFDGKPCQGKMKSEKALCFYTNKMNILARKMDGMVEKSAIRGKVYFWY